MKVLVTGATGYVGGKLLSHLDKLGYQVRCLVRSKERMNCLPEHLEVVVGNALDRDSLVQATKDCQYAYYLIHSMDGSGRFVERDRECALNFAWAATQSELQGITYVSGLASSDDPGLSDHLASRVEVGRILRDGGTPCTELRAAMVIGKGSLSFRMVEHLCRRLPVMLCPKWLSTITQPIAEKDLLKYLSDSIAVTSESRVFEIGGRDRVTYLQILKEYCRQQKLTRLMVPVPLLTPKLSALWLNLVTPETAEVGKAMIDGLRNPTFVRNPLAEQFFDIHPISVSEAIAEAISADKDGRLNHAFTREGIAVD